MYNRKIEMRPKYRWTAHFPFHTRPNKTSQKSPTHEMDQPNSESLVILVLASLSITEVHCLQYTVTFASVSQMI